jgi:hypothetical protein
VSAETGPQAMVPPLDDLLRRSAVVANFRAYQSLRAAWNASEGGEIETVALEEATDRLREALAAEERASADAVKQARARTHDAVSECQRRYASYQSRCDRFDAWIGWCRDAIGQRDWDCTSEAMRTVYLGLCADVERARRTACTVKAQNAAALALHRAIPFDSEAVADDYVPGCLGCLAAWPCPTARALGAGERV